MPRGKRARIDVKKLTKGQLRKLNALRKSLGDDIAERAFSQWYARQRLSNVVVADKNASAIALTLWKLVEAKKLRIGRKGYVVKRGRGRLIVAPAPSK
jgi:hypothetical protein